MGVCSVRPTRVRHSALLPTCSFPSSLVTPKCKRVPVTLAVGGKQGAPDPRIPPTPALSQGHTQEEDLFWPSVLWLAMTLWELTSPPAWLQLEPTRWPAE